MGDWNRSTKKMIIDEIQPEYWNAIQEHNEAYNLKLDFSDYLICVQTVSSKKKKKLFGGGCRIKQFRLLSSLQSG